MADSKDMDGLKVVLEKVLRDHEEDPGLTLTEITPKNCNVGDNFMSVASSVKVEGTLGSGTKYTSNIFVKRPVESKERREFCHMDKAFRNEVFVYKKVVPHIPDALEIIPQCLLATEDFVLMKDLSVEGYKMRDKCQGLDLAHAELVMKAIGKFHAGTYNMTTSVTEEGLTELLADTFNFVFENDQMVPLMAAAIESCIENLQFFKDETLNPVIDKLHAIKSGDFMKILEKMHDSNNLTVICHGDLWTNNLLFRYNDDGVVNNIKLLDFQLPRPGSIAIDLWTFLYTSVSPDLLNTKSDYLISLYIDAFLDSLEAAKFPADKMPTREEVLVEIYSRELQGLMLSFWYLPGILRDWKDNSPADMDNNLKNKEAAISAFFTVDVNHGERLKILAKRSLERGILEFDNVNQLPIFPQKILPLGV